MDIKEQYKKRITQKISFLISLVIALIFITIISINVGSSGMTVKESISTLLGNGNDKSNLIVFGIRLPK